MTDISESGIEAAFDAALDQAQSVGESNRLLTLKATVLRHPPASREEGLREAVSKVRVETLRTAVLSCPHTITADEIVLRRSDRMDGNALNQLHQRLAAALIPTKPEAREPTDEAH